MVKLQWQCFGFDITTSHLSYFNRFAISQTDSYGVARPTLRVLILGVLEAGSQARHQLSLLAEALLWKSCLFLQKNSHMASGRFQGRPHILEQKGHAGASKSLVHG